MSIKLKLGATGMAATALVASSCSIAEFDALMIVLKDLDYNNAEINNLLKGDSIDVARYFVERNFERSQWKAVTASVGYKEELMKAYVPMVQKFDAASVESETLAMGHVVQKTSVSDIVGLSNGLAEVGYDEKSLETVTDNPISLDSVRTIQDSGLVPELIEGIVGSDNVKTDDLGDGKTLLDKYVEFADIVSDGRSEDFMSEGEFDVTTIANSVNLLNDLGMADFEANNFDPSAAMAISEYLDGEYNAIKTQVWEDEGITQDLYDRLSDSQKANIDKLVEEALNGEMADLEDELVATTERLQRKTPTFLFKIKTLAEIQAVFPAFVDNQQVFDAVGALPGDEVSSADISVAVDLGDLASGAGVKIDALMEAFFEVTATFKEDGSEVEHDVNIKVDYTVASDFDENNVGSYTIGYEVDENYNGDIEDLKNIGTHLGATKFAYVVISDVDPVFGDPTNPSAPVSSDDFTNIDGDDFLIESEILDPAGNYDPNNSIASAMRNIEVWYGSTKIKFGAFESDVDAVEAEAIGTKLEIQFYGFDQLQNAWIKETQYDEIDDLEHLVTKSGTYQIRIVFTNQSGEEYLVGGKGVEFVINTTDIAPPTVRFSDSHYVYNFDGVGGNVATIANALTYGFDGQPSALNSNVIFFDNISSLSELQTGTFLLFDKDYISTLSAGAKAICQELQDYTHNGTATGIQFNIAGFDQDDQMCDVTSMGSEFIEENLLMDSQDDFKVLVTAKDEAGNWGYGTNEIELTNTAGIGIDFIGGQGTTSNPIIMDTYQSLYTTDMSKLRETLFDLATVSSNDLKWVQDITNLDPQSFNLVAGQSANYTDLIEYEYSLSDNLQNNVTGSIFVKFVDTTAPTITATPKVLSNTVAPTIKQGTDAMALFNTRAIDNDKGYISSTSGMFVTDEHVESIQMRWVNSMGNAIYTTLVNDGSSDWSVIGIDTWTSAEKAQDIQRTNPEGREMNITGHFGLMEFTYNVLITDPSGNSLRQPYVIPQVKVYDTSEPVLLSYAGTANIAHLQSNTLTLDEWRLPYSESSNVIENRLVLTDHTSRLTGYKTDAVTGFHIDVGQSSGRYVSFFWISQDLRRVNNTPEWNSNPVNSSSTEPFWNSFSSGNGQLGTIGNLDYDLLKEDWQGYVSGNGSYLYQNYNGTGLSLIMLPTMYTNITGAVENNDYIQTDIGYNYNQTHWTNYMGSNTGHYYLSIIQMLGRNTGGVMPYWNEFGTWS